MATEQAPQEAAPATAAEPPSTEASAASSAGPGPEGPGSLPELPLFSCKEAYVYRVPPATTAGHRAELWDVNKWLATVALRVVQSDDDAFIRLLEDKTGELFAECPVPTDKPLVTAVEPVVDSSRYYVLRIVDRDTQRHAFIGIGFRERNEASDFNAALHEFLQYIKRKRTAEAMRNAYEERLQAAAASEGSAQSTGELPPAVDYSLREAESLTLKISAPRRAGSGGFVSKKKGLLGKQFSLVMGEHGGAVAALSPPPTRSPRAPDMCVSPALEAGGGSPMHSGSESGGEGGGSDPFAPAMPRLSGAGDAELQQRLRGLRLQQGSGEVGPLSGSTSAASGSPAAVASATATDDDDFGDFEAA
ncbi:hypothetical protein ABPG75_006067 [Micractinium tetrahymenae]